MRSLPLVRQQPASGFAGAGPNPVCWCWPSHCLLVLAQTLGTSSHIKLAGNGNGVSRNRSRDGALCAPASLSPAAGVMQQLALSRQLVVSDCIICPQQPACLAGCGHQGTAAAGTARCRAQRWQPGTPASSTCCHSRDVDSHVDHTYIHVLCIRAGTRQHRAWQLPAGWARHCTAPGWQHWVGLAAPLHHCMCTMLLGHSDLQLVLLSQIGMAAGS